MSATDTPPFQVGDLVTSDFYRQCATVVLRVTAIRYVGHTSQSGWLMSAEVGDGVKGVYNVDSSWFKPVKQ